MRIAFAVLKYFPFGGLERDMLRMAESAAKRGHRVVIHTSKWEDDAPLPENIEVRLFPLKNIANHRRMQEFEQKFEQAVKESVFDVKVLPPITAMRSRCRRNIRNGCCRSCRVTALFCTRRERSFPRSPPHVFFILRRIRKRISSAVMERRRNVFFICPPASMENVSVRRMRMRSVRRNAGNSASRKRSGCFFKWRPITN